jgi:hypothetical protein
MHRDVERRQPVLDDPGGVVRLEVGQRREVAVPERQPVVVVADVEHLADAVRVPFDEAEVTAVGAAPDAWRLDGDPHRLLDRAFDDDLERLIGPRLLEDEGELLVRRQKLPVEKVLELAAIHRIQLGAGYESELLADRIGLDTGHLDHGSRPRELFTKSI